MRRDLLQHAHTLPASASCTISAADCRSCSAVKSYMDFSRSSSWENLTKVVSNIERGPRKQARYGRTFISAPCMQLDCWTCASKTVNRSQVVHRAHEAVGGPCPPTHPEILQNTELAATMRPSNASTPWPTVPCTNTLRKSMVRAWNEGVVVPGGRGGGTHHGSELQSGCSVESMDRVGGAWEAVVLGEAAPQRAGGDCTCK